MIAKHEASCVRRVSVFGRVTSVAFQSDLSPSFVIENQPVFSATRSDASAQFPSSYQHYVYYLTITAVALLLDLSTLIGTGHRRSTSVSRWSSRCIVPTLASGEGARRWCGVYLFMNFAQHGVKRRRCTCIPPISGVSDSGGIDWNPPRSTNTLPDSLSPRVGVVLPMGVQ